MPGCLARVNAGRIYQCRMEGSALCDPIWHVTLSSFEPLRLVTNLIPLRAIDAF